MRVTQPIPVSGYVQRSTTFGSPLFVVCSIITYVFLAPIARSIAPPTAGIASGAPVCQLARSPLAETWNAPRTQTSRWPPRIIAKLSAWWKKTPPGRSVTGCLPALMRSKSSSPSPGAGPMPITPFSLCRTISRPVGRWLATIVGKPMPRLTTAPSGMSRATRAAISARLHFGSATRSLPSGLLAEAAGARRDAVDADDPLHEDPGSDDAFGVERAEWNHLVHRRDRRLRRHCHHRAEVARRHPVREVAPAVAALGLDEGDVGVQRCLEDVHPAVDLARLLALRELGAVAGRREEAADASAGGADAFGEVALRNQLELELAGAVEAVEVVAVDLARERADDLANAPCREQRGEPGVAVAGIVVDDREVLRPLLEQRADELVRQPGRAEAADHHRRAVGDVGDGFAKRRDLLLDHRFCFAARSPRASASIAIA